MLFLSSSCQPVLAVKPRLPYPFQRSDKVLVECNFKPVHASYSETYLAAFTLYGQWYGLSVRTIPINPSLVLTPLPSLCPQLLCVFASLLICLNSSQQETLEEDKERIRVHFDSLYGAGNEKMLLHCCKHVRKHSQVFQKEFQPVH
ncbi:hypothetical protein F2Q69_00022623 [Brassica cretica]|uniref:Uncharacterized protein n=1 Tax=Brassica cretica TaxID=69181 RepID=A0A8S9QAD8_BRACR|nr:hypothetical protein F2Q69_00022623 [Brassica cretica]